MADNKRTTRALPVKKEQKDSIPPLIILGGGTAIPKEGIVSKPTGRPKPLIPRAGVTLTRRRYPNGGSVKK